MERIKYSGTGAAAATKVQTSIVYKPITAFSLTVNALNILEVDVALVAVVIVTMFAFSTVPMLNFSARLY